MTTDIEPPRIFPTLRCRDAEAMIGWLKTGSGSPNVSSTATAA